jgi:hypothetical protein
MALLAGAVSFMFCVTMLHPPGSHAIGIGGPGNPNPPARKGVVPGPPAMKTAPVQGPGPQKGPIQANPAFFEALYHALLNTDLGWDTSRLHFVLDMAKKDSETMFQSLVVYQKNAKSCATRLYTIEDQKKAGCLGTDTLNQCSTKLFDHCFGAYKNDKFLKDRNQLLSTMNWLENKLKAYTAKVKMIPKPK